MPKSTTDFILDQIAKQLAKKKDSFIGPLQTNRVRQFERKYPGGLHYKQTTIGPNGKSTTGMNTSGEMVGVGRFGDDYVAIDAPTGPYIKREWRKPLETRLRKSAYFKRGYDPLWEPPYTGSDGEYKRYEYSLHDKPYPYELGWEQFPSGEYSHYVDISKDELLNRIAERGVPIVDAATTRQLILGGELDRIKRMKSEGKIPDRYDAEFWDKLLEDN